MRPVHLLFCGPLILLAGCGSTPQADPPGAADLILHGGKILTMATAEAPDAAAPAPTALVVRDGRIAYVGRDRPALRHAGDATRLIDLKGAVVVPGLVDGHCHLAGLGKALAEIDLMGTTSGDDVLARVRDAMTATPGNGWLQGRGWDQNDWPEKIYPDARDLDAVTGDRPALLRRVDGHAAWTNSAALRLAGVTADTPDPDGGQILRDADGRPTGILIDNAVDLVWDIIPRPDRSEQRRRLELAMRHCVAHGLTGVHEAGVEWDLAGLYREMADNGELLLRIYGMYEDKATTLEPGLAAGPVRTADGMLTIGAVKLYADGALGSRGALMLDDYADQPGHRGLLVTSHEHLREVALAAGRAGFQVCTHAIGDGGNRVVLDLYEDLLKELGLTDARWRIEHAQILDPADIPRFAELDVIASMQPVHCTSDMDWADERLGDERLAGAYAWRSLLDCGARLCWGTDFPVEKVSALDGLYAARTRTHHDGTPAGGWQAQEKVDAYTALRLYTGGPAHASFAEKELGRIVPGYRADLTVLSGDPVACDPADLLEMQIVCTVVGGRVVHEPD